MLLIKEGEINDLSSVELIVGIPSYNEADNISFVTEQADKGLKKYFGDKKAVIVNVDNNSPDGTKQAFLETKTETPKLYVSTPPGVKGKGNNFFNLFKLVEISGAKAVVVVDADLKSITPEWILYLAGPVFKGNDFVTPIYSRHKYDGTITNNIVFPLIYGLTGLNIRQPIGGDFAFSNALAKHWLRQEWKESTRQYGIDNFMTTHAIFGGFKCCNTGLGAKIHKPSAPKLGEMFIQVVDTLFGNIIKNKDLWHDKELDEELPCYGLKELEKPQDLEVDYRAMKRNALYDFIKNRELLMQLLSEQSFKRADESFMSLAFDLSSKDWAKIVYDIMGSYSACNNKRAVIEALKPLYFARVVAFIQQTLDYDYIEAEKEILSQALEFKKQKAYLLSKICPEKLEKPGEELCRQP